MDVAWCGSMALFQQETNDRIVIHSLSNNAVPSEHEVVKVDLAAVNDLGLTLTKIDLSGANIDSTRFAQILRKHQF